MTTEQRKLKVGDVVYLQSDFDGATPMVVTKSFGTIDDAVQVRWLMDSAPQVLDHVPSACFVLAVDEEKK